MGAILKTFTKLILKKIKMKSDYNLPFTKKTEDQIVFQNPWHSQLFAITVQLSEKGNFSWKEFVEVFGESLKKQRSLSKELDGRNDYFSCWLNAPEEILIIKKISNQDTLMLLKKDWTQAYLSTPHGKPVNIRNRSV